MNKHEIIVKRLSELGNSTRLHIFRLLVRAGDDGLTVGDIQKQLGGCPGSTLSHHLSRLVSAGLIQQQRVGPALICTPQLDALRHVICYLQTECCDAV